jgi:glycosyltransferase involved in cell wall biosynthesis
MQMCAVDFTVKQFLLPLAGALRDHGAQVIIACAKGPYYDDIVGSGFTFIDNPISRNANVIHHGRSLWRTFRLLKSQKPDVVHVHTPVAALICRLAARFAGVPLIIYTAHGFYFHDAMKPLVRKALIALEKFGARCGHFIMTVSAEDEQAALRLGIAKPRQIETIFNGVDTLRFSKTRFSAEDRHRVREKYGISQDAPVIGIVGRMVREKGFFELFQAARTILDKFPQVRFMIVGDVLPSDYDGSKKEILQLVDSLKIKHAVAFTGLVDDTAPYLAAMDIFTLPSYREGMPVSLLEAMAMELPAVATDIRGCREEVADGVTGWLVPARDSRQLADKLLHLLDDPQQAAAMGRKARERVMAQFCLPAVVDHQVAIYRRLLEQTAGTAKT